MRVLITGASGFAGGYLARECVRDGDEVVGVSRSGQIPDGCGDGRALDLLDGEGVQAIVRDVAPDVVYHLAALSSVGRSWDEPSRTLSDNVAMAVNLLEALRFEAPTSRVVWVSSCEVYGAPDSLPVAEDAPLKPANPYAVSKTTGELLARVYIDAYGLDLVLARPFNHAGPGQRSMFILSSLARQAAEAVLSGNDSFEILTGNPDTCRDFTDVRDVVRAYRLLATGDEPAVYNVSSGRSISAADQVRLLAELVAPIQVRHVVDPDRVRAHEVMDLRGDHDRLTAATGWRPEIPLRETMSDTIEWWKQQLSAAAPTDPTQRVRH